MARRKGGLDKGLGNGINVLIPDNNSSEEKNNSGIIEVDINKVEPNKNQPRTHFDEDELDGLADSIKQHGVISPLLVQDKGDYYEIVGGERRWRASKMAGLKTVPIYVKEFTDQEKLEISLIENLQRVDLDPIEEATTYKRLMVEFDLTQDEVAYKVSKSRPAISNALRLLNLASEVQELLSQKIISQGHARALLGIKDSEKQAEFANIIIDKKLSVREVEKEIKKMQNGGSNSAPAKKKELDPQLVAVYSDLEEKLKESTGTKVKIVAKDSEKGKLEIEYYSKDDLERIVDKLQQ
ncbi:MAG: ParB/RepB/Spo0J family partition protein [Lachnospiraceae bacterium]|nr:ParB/RepB/Spo0J family partition protein [Lachnospiraceae bacterium]